MNSEPHFAPIAALDLDPIKVKLMHQESGEGWSLERADAVEFEYRRFLYLVKKFPNERAAPLFDVDVFWHYHILDTMKYAADCEAVFGYFLHHFPYLGLRGEDDLEVHHRVGERTRELYEQTYGEGYPQKHAPMSSTAGSKRADTSKASKVAWSEPASQVAWSEPASQVAWSEPASQVAWSEPAVSPASLGAGTAGNFFDAPGRSGAAMFNSVRPTLSRAA